MVVTARPATCDMGVTHERVGRAVNVDGARSAVTMPQPNFVPVRRGVIAQIHNSGMEGSPR